MKPTYIELHILEHKHFIDALVFGKSTFRLNRIYLHLICDYRSRRRSQTTLPPSIYDLIIPSIFCHRMDKISYRSDGEYDIILKDRFGMKYGNLDKIPDNIVDYMDNVIKYYG